MMRRGGLGVRGGCPSHVSHCAAQGRSITGADLDRQFGTRDYGRKVLRQLAAETTRSP